MLLSATAGINVFDKWVRNAHRCTTVGLYSASCLEKHENCTTWNMRENNRMQEDPLVQSACVQRAVVVCMQRSTTCFLPYHDIERNPNNSEIVLNDTIEIT